MWMLGFIMWVACSSAVDSAPERTEEDHLQVVLDLLNDAVEASEQGDTPSALERWQEAHEQFELHVEPSLEDACGRGCMTAMEYRLGGLRVEIGAASRTSRASLADIEDRLKHIFVDEK